MGEKLDESDNDLFWQQSHSDRASMETERLQDQRDTWIPCIKSFLSGFPAHMIAHVNHLIYHDVSCDELTI